MRKISPLFFFVAPPLAREFPAGRKQDATAPVPAPSDRTPVPNEIGDNSIQRAGPWYGQASPDNF